MWVPVHCVVVDFDPNSIAFLIHFSSVLILTLLANKQMFDGFNLERFLRFALYRGFITSLNSK